MHNTKNRFTNKKVFAGAISSFVALILALLFSVSPYPTLIANATIENPGVTTTQTGFTTLLEYQSYKWNDILSNVFNEYGTTVKPTTLNGTKSAVTATPPAATDSISVKENNEYFNWRTFSESDGVTPWDGTDVEEFETTTETISYSGDSVLAGDGKTTYKQADFTVSYVVYNVSNASELSYAMNQAVENRTAQNTKINITSDIDLNGAEQKWSPKVFNGMNKWFYIEGNGHTIYNMRCYNTVQNGTYGVSGFVGNFNGATSANFVMKNLNFSNCMSLSQKYQATSVAVGAILCEAYLENVNVYDSFVYSGAANTGVLIGRTESVNGNIFIRNCSSQRCYVFGTDHTGGLTGCQHNTGTNYRVKYNADFPESPEAWLNYANYVYPEMVENCYSVDCELFSVGSTGDSGGFISCGGKLICRNCFTNNIIYGNTKTGAFWGRIVTYQSGQNGLYDDNYKRTVEIYFENCYASGTIEGISRIGGFVGFEDSGGTSGYGLAIYKNCYTTAMVGMDYAGSHLGGFVGHENSAETQKTTVIIGYDESGNPVYNTNTGSVYMGCYAAGEVGNILTDTSTTLVNTTTYIGGFIGVTGYYGASTTALPGTYQSGERNGTFVDCCYDMQTTAMRERACGNADQFYPYNVEAIDDAVNSTAPLTEEQKIALLNVRDDCTSITDPDYDVDYSAIDKALDFITDDQRNALLDLRAQIQSYNSGIDVSAINDAVGIVNYDGSEKAQRLTSLNTMIRAAFPDTSIVDEVYKLTDVSTTVFSQLTDTQKARLLQLEEEINALKGTLLPSDYSTTTINDINGTITQTEASYLTSFRSNLVDNVLSKEDFYNNMVANGYTDDMLTALDDVIASVGSKITQEQNDKIVELRNILIKSKYWTSTYFTNSTAWTYPAYVTDLVTFLKRGNLNSVKTDLLSYCNTEAIDAVLANTKNTGLLTDAQMMALYDLRAELNKNLTYYNQYTGMTADDLTILDDLLEPMSDALKNALLSLKEELSGSGIDTGIIDEVTADNDVTAPLTESDKQALLTLKTQMASYLSQIPGVEGVYTQHSELKGVEGLADTVDMGDDTAWKNGTADDQYPMLLVFDDYSDDIFEAASFGTQTTEEEKAAIISQLEEKAETVQKYARASVSTVLLSHWDNTMNMDTGTLGSENDWVPGLPQNKLVLTDYAEDDPNKWTMDNDGQYRELTYKNLAAGSYEFKVQAGTSWAYNFGSNKFNGNNCVLNVPMDCDVKIKFDYIPNVSESGENTNFKIWAEFYNDYTNAASLLGTQELGKNENAASQGVWTLAGNFEPNAGDYGYWNPANTNYDLHYLGSGVYTGTFEFEPGDYEFKVTKDHTWAFTNGGKGGTADNMSFTVLEKCTVKFEFDENTNLTTIVSSNPSDALTNIQTESEVVTFEGYSLLGPATITGHEWIDDAQALSDCAMTDEDGNGIYEKTYRVQRYADDGTDNFSNFYGYKVIKDGNDIGQRKYYKIDIAVDDTTTAYVDLTFSYNPDTGQTTITPTAPCTIILNPQPDTYGVLGSQELTGLNWGKDAFDNEVPGAGIMVQNADDEIYTVTFRDVPAGEHSFKVAGNCTFTSGIDYGANGTSDNYQFTTTETADITIMFDAEAEHITVTSDPENAIFKDTFVVCGNTNLTGENKVAASDINLMEYDEKTGLYTKTYENLPSDEYKNYVFKVVKYAQNDNYEYNAFTVYSDITDDVSTYKFVITYDPNTKVTDYKLYDSEGTDVSEYIREPYIEYYSVSGDEGLTGYNWYGTEGETEVAAAAAEAGRMTADGNGNYTVTFKNVAVSPTISSLSFKVVANGNWDSGIDYGKPNGENYVITLASDTYTSCDVTITFNENTQQISVKTDPDCMAEIDETVFEWFVCGVYNLVSSDAYKNPKTVYDTVRDITYPFSFTAYESMNWYNDDAGRNAENNYFSNLAGGNGFSLDYSVDGKAVTGNFNVPVVKLESQEATDANGNSVTQYSCSQFMPGRQWIAVSVGNKADDIKGRRYLRLIPTAYLEAGNDADITVLQAGSDANNKNVNNLVTYRENSLEGVTYTGLTDEIFTYYNFALASGYAITDRVGMGYYGNYSQQKIQTFDESKLRANVLSTNKTVIEAESNTFYAMTSAFTQTASYSDADIPEGQTTNLIVDELTDQSLIGSSYDDGENYAKTIVKIYKKVEDPSGALEADGKRYAYPKVFMDSTEGSTSTYHTNYLKWTGQQPFDMSDKGTYFVTYFWSLSDGRYLTDSKKVYITTSLSDVDKAVDKSYLEKSGDDADKEIEYTITFTNENEGDFTICDIFPFNGDIRYDESKESLTSGSAVSDSSSFTLRSISIASASVESKDAANPATIDELNAYYTTSTDVESVVTVDEEGLPSSDIANNIDVTDAMWTKFPDSFGEGIDGATAFVVTGKQKNAGTTKVTITYTIKVNNPAFKDLYVNNVYFSVNNKVAADNNLNYPPITGYSTTPADTAVVGRGLSGYVWYDLDFDGKFDDNEPPLMGVTVTLMKQDAGGNYVSTGLSMTTDENGNYSFDDIYPAGDDYQVYFSVPGDDPTQSGYVTIMYSKIDSSKSDELIEFDRLLLSRRLSPYQVTDKSESRNIAQQDLSLESSTANKTYFINEVMPTADEIFINNNQRRYKEGSISSYYFLREFQNLALKSELEDKPCSLTVIKLAGGTDTPLEGVEFMLEYMPEDAEEYSPVTYTVDEDGNYVFSKDENALSGAVPTDENGLIKFTNLPAKAQYRLSEVKTLDGYNLLPTALEFTLPYYIASGKTSPDGYVVGNDEEPFQGIYYYDVTYTVTNSKIPHMPFAGIDYNLIPIIIAAILFFVSLAILAIIRIKTKKKNTGKYMTDK